MSHLGQCFHCLSHGTATVACQDFPLLEFCNAKCAQASWNEGSFREAHAQLYARQDAIGNVFLDVSDTATFLNVQYELLADKNFFAKDFDPVTKGYQGVMGEGYPSERTPNRDYIQDYDRYTAPVFTADITNTTINEIKYGITPYKTIRKSDEVQFFMEKNRNEPIYPGDTKQPGYLVAAFLATLMNRMSYPDDAAKLLPTADPTKLWVRFYEFKALLYQPLSFLYDGKMRPVAVELMIEAVKRDLPHLKALLVRLAYPITVIGTGSGYFARKDKRHNVFNGLRVAKRRALGLLHRRNYPEQLGAFLAEVEEGLNTKSS